jgi:hypothetical protein
MQQFLMAMQWKELAIVLQDVVAQMVVHVFAQVKLDLACVDQTVLVAMMEHANVLKDAHVTKMAFVLVQAKPDLACVDQTVLVVILWNMVVMKWNLATAVKMAPVLVVQDALAQWRTATAVKMAPVLVVQDVIVQDQQWNKVIMEQHVPLVADMMEWLELVLLVEDLLEWCMEWQIMEWMQFQELFNLIKIQEWVMKNTN